MKELKSIALIFIALITLGNTLSVAQPSPMDRAEKEILREYQLHQVDFILQTALQLASKDSDNGKIMMIDRTYKYNIRTVAKPIYFAHDGGVDQFVEFYINLDSRGRSYRVHVKNNTINLYSENMSFFVEYDLEKGEATLKQKIADGSDPLNGHEFKIYGFTYAYDGRLGGEVESWVVRDAIGRANSSGKKYE